MKNSYVKVRKTRKEDVDEFILMRKEFEKDYFSSVVKNTSGKKLTALQIKKQFHEIIHNPKRVLLFIEKNDNVCGFLTATIIKSSYKKFAYIDDVFIRKNFRRQGLAKKIVIEFEVLMKFKKAKDILLGVNIKNEKAINLYKSLGFKIKSYEMEKKLK